MFPFSRLPSVSSWKRKKTHNFKRIKKTQFTFKKSKTDFPKNRNSSKLQKTRRRNLKVLIKEKFDRGEAVSSPPSSRLLL